MNGSLTSAYEQFITALMSITAELKNLRIRKGVSQTGVALAIGCDQSTVSLWEQDKVTPSGMARKSLEAFLEKLREMPDAEKASAA